MIEQRQEELRKSIFNYAIGLKQSVENNILLKINFCRKC